MFVGDALLMSGINNGGQEYREYIWPVQAVFAIGVILIAYNLIRTIAARDLEEIYISNWYIMGGLLWTTALMVIAYLPWYQQNGISETVIQGFYMHMGVGMWFTPIVLGLTYYTASGTSWLSQSLMRRSTGFSRAGRRPRAERRTKTSRSSRPTSGCSTWRDECRPVSLVTT